MTVGAPRVEVGEETLVRLRTAIMRLGRRLRTTSAEEGLTPTQSSVVALLVREGPMRAGDLAGAEALNPTMLSRVLGHLEAAGLVVRGPDPGDGRSTRVEATAAARRVMRRLRARRGALLRARLEALPAEQVEALIQALPALEALADDAPPGGS